MLAIPGKIILNLLRGAEQTKNEEEIVEENLQLILPAQLQGQIFSDCFGTKEEKSPSLGARERSRADFGERFSAVRVEFRADRKFYDFNREDRMCWEIYVGDGIIWVGWCVILLSQDGINPWTIVTPEKIKIRDYVETTVIKSRFSTVNSIQLF